jgi:FkbM family methyltransferase
MQKPPIFDEFTQWRGTPPSGHQANFLGQFTRPAFNSDIVPSDGPVAGKFPRIDQEEIFEWITLLEAVLEAKDTFTMAELGAGFGRWLVAGACAIRQRRPDLAIRLIGVEAEPTHFGWMKEHLRDNGINPDNHRLIQAAATSDGRPVHFTFGHPAEWYGQSIIEPGVAFGDWPQATVSEAASTTIRRILRGFDYVDLIDMDIQGAELECVNADIDCLTKRVRRVFVATHSGAIHDETQKIFTGAGWRSVALYPPGTRALTEFGLIDFQDGVQHWGNPKLSPSAPRSRIRSYIRRIFG